MSKEGDVWELYYHPKLCGRAEFVRIIFEEVGEKFKEINDNVREFAIKNEREGYPSFAPPVLKKGTKLKAFQDPKFLKTVEPNRRGEGNNLSFDPLIH